MILYYQHFIRAQLPGVASFAGGVSKALGAALANPADAGATVKVHASLFALISDSILWAGLTSNDTWAAPVLADRKQQGCVRFSYLPAGSVVPRQFECVQQEAGSVPIFYSLGYGAPDYAKLSPFTDKFIRQGADDGGEMGAFHFVLAPLRENDLRIRLQEYLPVGMEFGIFYQT